MSKKMSYWKDLAGRMRAFIQENILVWAKVALVAITVGVQFGICIVSSTFLLFTLRFGLRLAIGFGSAFLLIALEILLYFDYEDFKRRHHTKKWRSEGF